MRIGLAADTFKPYISGVTIYVANLMKELQRRGHEVHLFTFGRPPAGTSDAHIHYGPGFPLRMGYQVGLGYTPEMRRTLRTMDVVHVHHPFVSGRMVLREVQGSIPVLFTAHTRYDLFSGDYLPRFLQPLVQRRMAVLLQRFCASVDRVVCNSPASEEGLRKLGVQAAVRHIPNGIPLELFTHERERTGRLLGIDTRGKTVFVYVGRLAAEKNLLLLLESFRIVREAVPDVVLVMGGSGPLRPLLEAAARERGLEAAVRFTGPVPYEAVPEFLAEGDIFCMPSFKDTHPLTVIEAMASGLPPVVVESPAYADLVAPDVTGLVSPNTALDYAAQLQRLATNYALRKSLGQASRVKAATFSMSHTVDLLESLYMELAGRQ